MKKVNEKSVYFFRFYLTNPDQQKRGAIKHLFLYGRSRFELAKKLVCTSNERRAKERRSAKPMSAEHVAKRNNLVNPTNN